VANKRVNIYERLKINGEWTDRPVHLPKLTREETLNPKDDRSGRFYVTWYDGQKKCRHPEPLILLSDAVNIKVAKEFYLRNRKRAGVIDTTIPQHRLPLRASPEEYLSSLSGCKKTKTAHRQAVREFLAWNTKICEYEFRKEFVDQIDKAHLMRFMDYLVDDDPDNCPFTAAWKLMRVNKWIRTVLHVDPGKGPIKKSDLRRELESNAVAEIYTQGELKAVFAVMGEEEFLRYETLLKSGLRKKELMYEEAFELFTVQHENRSAGPAHARKASLCCETRWTGPLALLAAQVSRDVCSGKTACWSRSRYPARVAWTQGHGEPERLHGAPEK
jgi:hypothetical protein